MDSQQEVNNCFGQAVSQVYALCVNDPDDTAKKFQHKVVKLLSYILQTETILNLIKQRRHVLSLNTGY